MPRAHHAVLAWLTCAALQLALLGVSGVGTAPSRVADPGTRPQSAWPAVSAAKRVLAPEPTDHRATITPFAPAAYVRLAVPVVVVDGASYRDPQRALRLTAAALPPARAPPAPA